MGLRILLSYFWASPPMARNKKKNGKKIDFKTRQDTFFKGLRAAIQNWPKKNHFFLGPKIYFLGIRILLSYFWASPPMARGKKKLDFFSDVKTRFLKGTAPLFKIDQK